MVCVCDEESESTENFSCHIALHQGRESFHERRKDIARECFGLESVQKSFDNTCTKLASI
jgi:hypothetical protein